MRYKEIMSKFSLVSKLYIKKEVDLRVLVEYFDHCGKYKKELPTMFRDLSQYEEN